MKRAGIYVFYDKDGIVDDYAPYFVRELRKVTDYILVVVNGCLTPEGREKFENCADDLFVRPNEGYDSWAYKEGIEYIGWERLHGYDELVIANSSIFGPIFPFEKIFEKMDQEACDCWGMNTAPENRKIKNWYGVPLKWGFKPETIPSNFHVYRSKVLHSYEFMRFWINLHPIRSYYEAAVYMEFSIVQDLKDAGFVWKSVENGQLQKVYPSSNTYGAFDLISIYEIPTIRKKAFYDSNGTLDFCENHPNEILNFISENTAYDVNLILENLLRTVNQYDLKNWFNLNKILPSNYVVKEAKKHRIACIFHVYDIEIMDRYLHNLDAFPEGTDFYFTTDQEEKCEKLQNLIEAHNKSLKGTYRLKENRGRDVSALLVACRDIVLSLDYDLICFMHDKKGIGASLFWSSVGVSTSTTCFENIAPTAEYVTNILKLFEDNPRLGIAVPPSSRNGQCYGGIGGSWTINFQKTKDLLQDLHIDVPLDPKKMPVAPYGSVFWFRPEALLPMFEKEWRYEDFPAEPMPNDGTISHAIERGYSYVAQGRGYFTTIVMSALYAEQEITRMTEIAHTYIDMTQRYVGGGKPMLSQATAQMERLLANCKKGVPAVSANPPKRGPLKRFVRGICPIGVWNLCRRVKCTLLHQVYIEPAAERGALQSIVRACTPRFLWDQLRKARCRKRGWVFIEA